MTRMMYSGALLLVILLTSPMSVAQEDFSSARVFREVRIDQKLDEQIPLDIEFRDESGKTVKLGDYFRGKPVIISLVYYNCPMLCTQILNGMVESFRVLAFTAGKEFEIVTVSIDPTEREDLAAAKKEMYVKEYGRPGVAEGWHFLTGEQASITHLADAVGYRYVYDEKTKQYAHGSAIMVATPDGRLARYLYGIEYGGKDLTFSLMEATAGKIGTPVDKILLLCYHYDPATGKYSVLVTNLLRAGAVISLVILGGFMMVNFLRDRKKSRVTTGGGA